MATKFSIPRNSNPCASPWCTCHETERKGKQFLRCAQDDKWLSFSCCLGRVVRHDSQSFDTRHALFAPSFSRRCIFSFVLQHSHGARRSCRGTQHAGGLRTSRPHRTERSAELVSSRSLLSL